MNIEYLKDSIKENEVYQKKNKKDKYINNLILNEVENFIIKNKFICYGGTAINNILPKDKQYYNYEIDIPDYDFFSTNALEDAKKLCNILSYHNVYHIEGKSAFFYGTYKVFVNFVPIADITQIDEVFYKNLLRNSIKVNKILYTPPDFLRMSLHQELARPLGDVNRWEKIYNRMNLLNIYFPVKIRKKKMNDTIINLKNKTFISIYNELENVLILNDSIFCNFNLILFIYKKYIKLNKTIKKDSKEIIIAYNKNLDDLITTINSNEIFSSNISIRLDESKYKFINIYSIIFYKKKIIAIVIQTNSCLSYNTINNKNIGNIDTILNLYFSFLLMDYIPINKNYIRYVIYYLYKVIYNYNYLIKDIKNIPNELLRFNLPCLGKQDDFQHIAKERVKQYQKYKNKKYSIEYKKWFFKYSPFLKNKKTKTKSKTKSKIKSKLF